MTQRHAKIFRTEDWVPRLNYVDVPENADGLVGVRSEVFESVDGSSNPLPRMRRNNVAVTVRYQHMIGQTSASASPNGREVIFNPVLGQMTSFVNTANGTTSTRDMAISAAHDRLCVELDELAASLGHPHHYMQPGAVYTLPGE